ncbi:hypothetical protein AC1031_006060 [Aphanomyces cochlioides]|nr:hypothetical protein AC1031_006056 [Aphanomyces cochlioides]KAG9403415.1 hypothetical protein AC1031_006060 [Aphanomyces cochlioides]
MNKVAVEKHLEDAVMMYSKPSGYQGRDLMQVVPSTVSDVHDSVRYAPMDTNRSPASKQRDVMKCGSGCVNLVHV